MYICKYLPIPVRTKDPGKFSSLLRLTAGSVVKKKTPLAIAPALIRFFFFTLFLFFFFSRNDDDYDLIFNPRLQTVRTHETRAR